MTFAQDYLTEAATVLDRLDRHAIEAVARGLAAVRDGGGRLFVLGVGGSAANASHAVNDARKLCGIEAYAPTDNVSELTARINDESWASCFEAWLKVSRVCERDALFVFSVGGGTVGVSQNIVWAIDHAKRCGAGVFGIVGRDGGETARLATACVIVPPVFPDRITAHTEGIAMVAWHAIANHPKLRRA